MIATAAACPFMMICVKEPAWSSRTILTGSPQHFSHDLYQLGRHWNLLQAFSRGTGRDHAKARDCMSRGSHQKKKNTKIVRRPWTRFSSQHAWENLITSLARANFTKFRYKSLPRASHNGIHTSTSMTWHLQAIPTGTSERKFLQDSHKKAPVQDHARPPGEEFYKISTRARVYEIYNENAPGQDRPRPWEPAAQFFFCTSLRSRNAHGHVMREFREKIPGPRWSTLI